MRTVNGDANAPILNRPHPNDATRPHTPSHCGVLHVGLWPSETGELAKAFIDSVITGQGVERDQLILQADRGASSSSKSVAHLLFDLGADRSHSRPHVSNDNPCCEAAFKTLKYYPAFPDTFGSIQHARQFCGWFFATTTTNTAAPASLRPPSPTPTNSAVGDRHHGGATPRWLTGAAHLSLSGGSRRRSRRGL